MFNVLLPTAASVVLLAGQIAHADIKVTFVESAPKDRFVLSNTSQCALQGLVLNLDLSSSAGQLIFDTTATGAGVEVFQPFEVSKGSLKLLSSATVKDGDSRLSVSIESIPANNSVSFTIDVDDTLTQSELGNIRVAGSEITNAAVEISIKGEPSSTATFDSSSTALISLPPC